MEEFYNWLKSDSAPGWLFGIISTTISVAVFLYQYINRKKPSIVICKEIDKVSLVRVSKKIIEKTKVSYNNYHVKNLSLVSLDLFNKGTETIKNLKIVIEFDKNTKILDIDTTKTSDLDYKKLANNNTTQL